MNPDIIFLTGFMGTGKSASGVILAGMLGRRTLDTDELIEKEAGMTVAEIFDRYGEEGFRRLEASVLNSLAGGGPCVVSAGGGMSAWGNNLETMKKIGVVAALTASPAEILRRISSSGTVRPLLVCGDPLSRIISLLQKRAYYYIKSHIMVNTDGKGPAAVAEEIKERLGI